LPPANGISLSWAEPSLGGVPNYAMRRADFRKLHDRGCFVMPNPWDSGSAAYLERIGFRALATSSAALAFSRALPDSPRAFSRERVLEHVRDIVDATELPVSADFQSGYADDLDRLAENVRLCVQTGAAGLSIEDATGNARRPLFDLQQATKRVAAARLAIDATGAQVVLTGRAECFLVGHRKPLEECIKRLRAYAKAGADVLFAPGLRDSRSIEDLVNALDPKPVNVLVGEATGLRVADLAKMGVRRISVGSALARTGWTAFMHAADLIAASGDFGGFKGIATTRDVSRLFGG
jgi:2-methylisocitrate lyase-like PEP mutase family enzyme